MGNVDRFLSSLKFAVAGASTDRGKYGNRVLRAYLQRNMAVVPINTREISVEGVDAVKSVEDLPGDVDAISIVTPPAVTTGVVRAALDKGITNIWIQPGAESVEAVKIAIDAGANLLYGGICVLVELGAR